MLQHHDGTGISCNFMLTSSKEDPLRLLMHTSSCIHPMHDGINTIVYNHQLMRELQPCTPIWQP